MEFNHRSISLVAPCIIIFVKTSLQFEGFHFTHLGEYSDEITQIS